jgi:DNA-binding HxlR family transcriptional regulator
MDNLQEAEEPVCGQTAVPTDCPLTAAMAAFGGKWSMICLYWLSSGTRRFNELRRLMPEISHKVLTETLRGLEQDGLVDRTVYAEVPPKVEYSLSAYGENLRPIIKAVLAWGYAHIEWRRQASEQRQSAIAAD